MPPANPNGASNGVAALHQASDTGDTIQPAGLAMLVVTASGMARQLP